MILWLVKKEEKLNVYMLISWSQCDTFCTVLFTFYFFKGKRKYIKIFVQKVADADSLFQLLGAVSSGSVDEDMIEKDDQMDITDENDEAQDLTVGKQPAQEANPTALAATNILSAASSGGFGGGGLPVSSVTGQPYQHSMLGILINKFGFSGIQVYFLFF